MDGTTSLWHDEPLAKLRRSIEGGERADVLMNRSLEENNYEAEEGSDAACAERVKNLVDRWD